MIELSSVSVEFKSGDTKLLALDNINLLINQGEFVVVIGANGSGKSTLLNSIAGNCKVKEGSVLLNKNDVTQWPDYKRSKFISRIFQNPLSGTAPDLSIIDNFRLAAIRTHSKNLHIGIDGDFRKKVHDQIAFLEMGLENKLDQSMGSLSGGQRQALTLIMSVMDETKILLLDEPTAALDPKSAEIVLTKTQHLVSAYKLTALLVTHEIKFASIYGNRLIQMAEGKILKDLDEIEKSKLTTQEIYSWFN